MQSLVIQGGGSPTTWAIFPPTINSIPDSAPNAPARPHAEEPAQLWLQKCFDIYRHFISKVR